MDGTLYTPENMTGGDSKSYTVSDNGFKKFCAFLKRDFNVDSKEILNSIKVYNIKNSYVLPFKPSKTILITGNTDITKKFLEEKYSFSLNEVIEE